MGLFLFRFILILLISYLGFIDFLRVVLNDHGLVLVSSYLQTVPEPPVVLYNRLSKCGSTTMQLLFEELSKKNDFGLWNAPMEYWHDLDIDKQLRKHFLSDLNKNMKAAKGKKFLADGHWWQTTFSPEELEGKVHENIQLLRECKSRRHSKFFYGLFDSSAATAVKETKTPQKFKKYEHDYLRTDINVKDCLNDYQCLKGTTKFDHNDTEIVFLCGSKCEANLIDDKNFKAIKNNKHHIYDGEVVSSGAISNIHNPKVFTVIGVLDYMEPFMEMLECIYPSMLNGIHSTFVSQQVCSRNILV